MLSIIRKLPGCPQAEEHHQLSKIIHISNGHWMHLCVIHLLPHRVFGAPDLLFCGLRGILCLTCYRSPQGSPPVWSVFDLAVRPQTELKCGQTSSSELWLISAGMGDCSALPNPLLIPLENLRFPFFWLKLPHFNKMNCCSWFADG